MVKNAHCSFRKILVSVVIWVLSFHLAPYISFAQENIHCFDLVNPDFSQFDVFDQDVKNMKIIALGERHYLKSNHLIQAELWMHLNKQFGIRHLLIEFGRSEAYLYNQYLKTGDEKYLQKTTYGVLDFKEFFQNWNKLYEFNLNLNPEKKLSVHGLDFEREPAISFAIYELLSKFPQNEKLDALRSDIRARIDTILIVRENKEYIDYLKTRIEELSLPYNHQKIIIDDILSNESFFSKMSARDKYMVKAFIALDTLNEAYFGQFGAAHTWMYVPEGFTSLLDDAEAYERKVLVINMNTRVEVYNPNNELSECEVFFFKVDPSDEQFNRLKEEGQWVLFLKDPPTHPTPWENQ